MSLLGSTAAISRMASAPLARALNTWYACSNGTGMGVGSVKKLQPRLGGAGGISPAPSWVPHWQAAHLDNELLAQQRALHARLTDERQVLKAALHGQAGASMRGTLVQSLRAAMGPTHKLAWWCQMHAPRVRVPRSIAASAAVIACKTVSASLTWKYFLSVSTDRHAAPPASYACAICSGRERGSTRTERRGSIKISPATERQHKATPC